MPITKPENVKLVETLTLEYVRQNELLKCSKEELPDRIKLIDEISDIIEKSVSKKDPRLNIN